MIAALNIAAVNPLVVILTIIAFAIAVAYFLGREIFPYTKVPSRTVQQAKFRALVDRKDRGWE